MRWKTLLFISILIDIEYICVGMTKRTTFYLFLSFGWCLFTIHRFYEMEMPEQIEWMKFRSISIWILDWSWSKNHRMTQARALSWRYTNWLASMHSKLEYTYITKVWTKSKEKNKLKRTKLCTFMPDQFETWSPIDSAFSFALSDMFQFFIYLNSHSEVDTFNSHLILYHVSLIRL